MPDPVHIAAIDAGSNAVRLLVVRAYSALDMETLHNERYPLRLGEGVFVRNRFSEEIIKKALKAFRHFRDVMDEFGVTRCRAVATSASREAANRQAFMKRVKQRTGIRLEVINSLEESRLGREAVFATLGPDSQARCIADLGGGSLELSVLRDDSVLRTAQLPVGTVRLMTTLNLHGKIRPVQAEQVRKYLRALLESKLASRPNLADGLTIALGGNAETLANVAPGPRHHGLPTLELSLLRERLPDLLRMDNKERMKSFGVRRDRADVMGIAAIIFVTLGRYLNVRTFAVPAVGIREGMVHEIAKEAFSRKEPHRYTVAARQILAGARSFSRRLERDQRHAEHVRELSMQLFDQLQPMHHLPAESRVILETAALLHDIGHSVSHKGHHKHGEYLTMNGDIPGLEQRMRAMTAAVVRYHNRKAEPASHHISYATLNNTDRRIARKLASMVRISEGLDHSHRERIQRIRATFQKNAIGLQLETRGDASEDVRDATRSAELFEKEFHTRLFFRPLIR